MNKKSIAGIAIAVAIVISVIVISYVNMPSKSASVGTINQPSNSTSQVQPTTTGRSYTLNLTESVAVKNP